MRTLCKKANYTPPGSLEQLIPNKKLNCRISLEFIKVAIAISLNRR